MTIAEAPADLASRPAHASSVDDVVRSLGTDVDHGLTAAAAAEHLARYGRNELAQAPPLVTSQLTGLEPVRFGSVGPNSFRANGHQKVRCVQELCGQTGNS